MEEIQVYIKLVETAFEADLERNDELLRDICALRENGVSKAEI
jgi:hypothetical protein